MGGKDTFGVIDFTEGGGDDLAPKGITRMRRKGGILQTSADGAAYSTIGAGGGVSAIVAGTGISVNSADPANPIVSAPGAGFELIRGTDLTGADQTINPMSDGCSLYVLPTNAQVGNATLSLGTTGSGSFPNLTNIWILRMPQGAFTYTIKQNGGSNLVVLPASPTIAIKVGCAFSTTAYIYNFSELCQVAT